MNCPKCNSEMARKPRMFCLTWPDGRRYYSGLVCESCNALYEDPEDSFKQAALEREKGQEQAHRDPFKSFEPFSGMGNVYDDGLFGDLY